ncbi:MAG: hypothetical protein HZC12_10120 [Nitrospirae bacterium]|nr:hypothetical protein [Nitrospirota bacterium]
MRKIIIDTSPLIIHLVGVFNGMLVSKVSLFNSPEDELKCIDRLISRADDIFITPYVLCELFWLTKQRLSWDNEGVKKIFIRYREMILRFKEIFIEKSEIIGFENLEFGPTDVSLFLAAKKLKYPILTADKPFIAFCKGKKLDVIDFTDPLFNPQSIGI